MKNNRVIVAIIFMLGSHSLFGNDGGAPMYRLLPIQDSLAAPSMDRASVATGLFEGRKGTALLYSLVIPGSGQTKLGSPYKGFSFTFVAFGSALTALISHNNFVASNERMDALEFQYKSSTTWQVSNSLYSSMNDVYTKLNRYKRTRNAFAIISAFVWSLNIADVIYNTDDEGETVFSSIRIDASPVAIAGGVVDHQQRLVLSVPLK